MINVLIMHSSNRIYLKLREVIDSDKVNLVYAPTPENAIDTFYTSKKSFDLIIFDVISTSKPDCFPGITAASVIHNDYPSIHLVFLYDKDEMIDVNKIASKEGIRTHELIFYNDHTITNLNTRIQSFNK